MATADIVAQQYVARWELEWYQDNIWSMLARDYTSEKAEFGDRLVLPSDATVYRNDALDANSVLQETTVAGLQGTDPANLEYGTPIVATANGVSLIMDKTYKVNELIGEMVEGRLQPSLLQSAAEHQARVMREQFNKDIRDKFAAAAAPQRLTPIGTSSANWGNDAHKTAINSAILQAELAFDYAHAPRMPGRRYAAGNPADIQLLQTYLIDKNYHFMGPTNDQMINDGVLMRYRGFDFYPDSSLGAGTTNTDDRKHDWFFGVRGEGIGYAIENRSMRVVQSERYIGWLVIGWMSHGAVINQPSKVRIAQTNIT